MTPLKLSGAITGIVSDPIGVPQMGATVLLFNRQDRAISRIQTDGRGEFKFAGLVPEGYSIRVSLASFLPAFRRDILVQPGMRSILHVSLSTLLSSIQIAYPVALESGSIMSDDWKWVLRSATATRPVLRLIERPPSQVRTSTERAAIFSDTRGLLRVSAGDGPLSTGIGNEADMGTAFALATSLYGNNLLQVSGNVGYGSQTGVPAAAFRTSYSRELAGGTPEVSLTMRQLFLPARLSAALAGNEAALPMLRSMSASFDDATRLAESVTLQYGVTMDAVTFLDRVSYFSPYARLTYTTADGGRLDITYSSGNARPDLGPGAQDGDLQNDLNSLGLFPRVSLRDAHAKIQRGEEYEVAWSQHVGSRTYVLSAYHEMVRNAALSLVAPEGMFAGGDVLPDLFSGNAVFNIGDHQNSGFSAGVTQSLGDYVSAGVTYSSEGALAVEQQHELVSNNPDDLRSMIRTGRKHAATARVNVTAPHSGTHMIASYQWSGNQRWAMSGNLYGAQPGRPLPGLNLYVRQPLPRVALLPWRMEATADLRNMLAQGYVPITAGGQRVMLVEQPRSFRGGLSFIF